MATTADIRKGLTIKFNHDIYSVVEFLHVKPGKGAAFVRTKLKSLTTGRVLDNTFPSGHKLEEVRVERKVFQYLYQEGDTFVFMDTETYDQMNIPEEQVPGSKFLKDGMNCEILFNTSDDSILSVDLPQADTYEITYTEPGVKGDTATNTLKPATIETGAEVRVPLFINIGDKVKVNIETGAYMERVKS